MIWELFLFFFLIYAENRLETILNKSKPEITHSL